MAAQDVSWEFYEFRKETARRVLCVFRWEFGDHQEVFSKKIDEAEL
jgi:hypothetical protein